MDALSGTYTENGNMYGYKNRVLQCNEINSKMVTSDGIRQGNNESNCEVEFSTYVGALLYVKCLSSWQFCLRIY